MQKSGGVAGLVSGLVSALQCKRVRNSYCARFFRRISTGGMFMSLALTSKDGFYGLTLLTIWSGSPCSSLIPQTKQPQQTLNPSCLTTSSLCWYLPPNPKPTNNAVNELLVANHGFMLLPLLSSILPSKAIGFGLGFRVQGIPFLVAICLEVHGP